MADRASPRVSFGSSPFGFLWDGARRTAWRGFAARAEPGADYFSEKAADLGRALRNPLCPAALLALLLLIAFQLFRGMTSTGMTGVDTFEYWKYADDITRGEFQSVFNRLSFYVLNVASFAALGKNDYAMRAFIGAAALLNVLLVFLVALQICRSALVSVATAAVYAGNPVVLYHAHVELPHIYGATFVLLSIACFLPAASARHIGIRARLAAAALAGFWAAQATLTHEDLVFVAAAEAAVLALLCAWRVQGVRDVSRGTALLALLAGGALGGLAATLAVGLTPWRMANDFLALRAMVDQNTATRIAGLPYLQSVAPRILSDFFVVNLGDAALCVLAVAAAAAPALWLRARLPELRDLIVVLLLIALYVLAFVFVARVYLEAGYYRHFIPLLGPTLIAAFAGAFLVLRPVLRWRAASLAVAALATTLACERAPALGAPIQVSPHRQLYDATKALVTGDRKLLLPACFALEDEWVGIGSRVYLGPNAVSLYLRAAEAGSFDEFAAAHRIGYAFVPAAYHSLLMPLAQIDRLFATFYGVGIPPEMSRTLSRARQDVWRGDDRFQWSPEACAYEARALREAVRLRGGRLVSALPQVGEIYEVGALRPASKEADTPGDR